MKKAFFILLSMMLSISVIAQQQIQLRSVDKAECVKSDMTSLKASFSFSTIEAQDYTSERGTFSWLNLPNTVIGGNEGEPQIPVVNELIAVPFGARPRIEITSFSSTDYRLEDYGIHTLVPRQPSLRKDKNPEEVPFVMNEAAYQSTRGFRSTPMATVNVMGTMRGVQLGKMTIEPVSYDPVNNIIRVFNNIEVEVFFDGADARATEDMLVKTYSPYFDIVYKQLFNERAVRSAYDDHQDLYRTPVKMLVVATSAYQSSTAFQNWLTWKKQKGIDVDIYTVTSSTASSTIRTEIQSRYNANHPTFLVIVGDETVVPAYKTNWSCGSTYGNCINDNEYASIDSDVYHDMFMSRMSVSSTTELSNLVNKILTYEKYTMSDPTYLNNTLLVAGWDASWTNRVGKPTIQYANNNYYNSAHGINPTVYITTGSGQTAAWNNINNVGFVNYTAHGDIQELADPEFSNSNANAMTNNDKYLWVVANCCLSANWGNSTYKPCLGETMIRAANKGAFGYIGSIPESYWYEDYYFGVGAFSYVASTVQTTSSTTTGMYDAAFDDTGFNTLNSMPYIGNVAVTCAHAVGYTSSVTDEYYWRAYQCLGDGSVMPYLNNPAANNVSHASTINIGATSFSVSADAGSYVSITKNNEILGVAQVPSSGTISVEISGLTSAGDVMIVVTRNQRQPYITTIQAIANDGPFITLDSYTPNTALVGQSTNLSLTLKNVGTTATSGTTTVTLSSTDSNVSFGTYSKTFNSLAVNATTTVSGFSFTLNNGVTLGSPVTLHYRAVNGSNTWEGDFTVVPNQIFTVNASANNSNYGSVSGGGQYNYNQSCTVTATPADGYMFTSWTQDGNIVSTNAEYTFNVTSNTNLVANFASGVAIGSGTETNEYLPTYNYYKYSLTEQIYTSAELGSAGAITSIAFYNGGAEKTRTLDFYLKATTKSSFSSKTDWISVSSSDKVFSGSVTMVANDWTTIVLNTPFNYDGTSNVVLVTDDNTGEYTYSPHMACRVFAANGNQTIYIYSDNTNYNPSSPTTSQSSNYDVLSKKNQLILTKESSVEYYNITATANPAEGGYVTIGGRGNTDKFQVELTEDFENWSNTPYNWQNDATYPWTVVSEGQDGSFALKSGNAGTDNSTSTIEVTVDIPVDGQFSFDLWSRGESTNDSQDWDVSRFYIDGEQMFQYGQHSGWESYSSDITAGTHTFKWTYKKDGSVNPTGDCFIIDNIVFVSGESGDSASGTFYEGQSCTVTATPNMGYSFVNWTENGTTVSTNASYTFTVTGDRDLVANFSQTAQMYTITATANPTNGGTITGAGPFAEGQTCTLIATPATGYTFTNWTKNGSVVSTSANYSFTVNEAGAYVANFTLNSYAITASVNPANAGTVTGAGTYNHGASVTLTATANTGYTFTNWTKNGTQVSTNVTYTFTVNEAAAYVANFTPNSYVITAIPEPVEGGTVAFGSKNNRDELVYDFEDGWQGWTTFQGSTTSPNSWMHNTEYPTSNNNFSTGYGYNNSDGFMLSESYISGTSSGSGTAVTPDNYLVSPQVRLGGSISFYAGARNTSYCAEKFSVMVSTTDNTNAASFTTVGTWTLSLSQVGYNSTPYTVDLSAYSGMGYIAIRHYDCYDQWFLCVDNVTIVEGEEEIPEDNTISGTFNYGESCTLVATPNADYHFVNWTENGTAVSSSATYTFTVTGDRDLVANFSQEQVTEEQTVDMPNGWGWWSTYIETNLNDLETALGTNGISIVSQTGSVSYLSGYGWDGTLEAIDLARMYEINVNGNVELTLNGLVANPANHEITIHSGWNWIGYPVQQSMSVANALANLNAANGDFIKSKTAFSTYDSGNWTGGLNNLQPGEGYMYYSTASNTKTFCYPTTGGNGAKANLTSDNNYWTSDHSRFANNMNVLAVVELDGAEAYNDNIEVGAFVGNECRGSVRLMRVENSGRYMAFLTIHGETGEPVSFRVLDGNGEREVEETIDLRINTVVGDMNKPFVLHANNGELVLFPNPVTKGEVFNLTMPSNIDLKGARVEVYNALGSLVRTETLNGDNTKMAGLLTAGVYTVKVTDRQGNVNFAKLVVR